MYVAIKKKKLTIKVEPVGDSIIESFSLTELQGRKAGENEREETSNESKRNRIQRNALYMPESFHAGKTDLLFSNCRMRTLCSR